MSAWSAQQAQWLRALGYRVLVRREADWTGDAPVTRRPPAQPQSQSRPASPPPERRVLPPAANIDAAPAPAPAPAPSPAPSPVAPPQRADASAKLVALDAARRQRAFNDPRYADLLGNLLRVAGLQGDAGRERLRELDVDLPNLHRDPAAKRALWPQLRSLRRAARQ